jgi:hypothetical protein
MVLVNYVTIHTSEMKDCVKAGGLLDYLYWTQTDSDAADMATAYVSSRLMPSFGLTHSIAFRCVEPVWWLPARSLR